MAQITAKGQITIPAELRRKYGLLPGAEVQVVEKDGLVVIQLAHGVNRGRWIAEQLRGKAKNSPFTTDEIMALTRGETDGSIFIGPTLSPG